MEFQVEMFIFRHFVDRSVILGRNESEVPHEKQPFVYNTNRKVKHKSDT